MPSDDENGTWEDDDALLGKVQVEFPDFTVRDARYLRMREVFHLPPHQERRGGRRQRRLYPPGSAEIALAVEQAKLDPDYRGKFWRVVLIAWGSGADVADPALRKAYKDDALWDLETTRNGNGAKAPSYVPRTQRGAVRRTLDEWRLGASPSPSAVMTAMTHLVTPEVLARMVEQVPAILPIFGLNEFDDQEIEGQMPEELVAPVREIANLAEANDDSITSVLPILMQTLAPLFAKASEQMLAQSAPREDLDRVRDRIRACLPNLEAITDDGPWRPLEIARTVPRSLNLLGPLLNAGFI